MKTFWIVWLKIIPQALCILAAIGIASLESPAIGIVFLISIVLSFFLEKSTRIPASPLDGPNSRQFTLSYQQYDRWAHHMHLGAIDPAFFSRNDIHWTEKLSVLNAASKASRHCMEPARSQLILCLIAIPLAIFFFPSSFQESLKSVFSVQGEPFVFFYAGVGFCAGYCFGDTLAGYYRWLRGQM